jgi:hypothetical protein
MFLSNQSINRSLSSDSFIASRFLSFSPFFFLLIQTRWHVRGEQAHFLSSVSFRMRDCERGDATEPSASRILRCDSDDGDVGFAANEFMNDK